MKTSYASGHGAAMPINVAELMMLMDGADTEERSLVTAMLSKAKQRYVESHHTRSIYQIHSKSKYKDGKWRTYLYVDGSRRPIEADSKDELYEKLYDYYATQNEKSKSLNRVFDIQ